MAFKDNGLGSQCVFLEKSFGQLPIIKGEGGREGYPVDISDSAVCDDPSCSVLQYCNIFEYDFQT